MHQAFQLLTKTRQDRGFSLEEVSKSIRAPAKYLSAIETGDFANLPEEPYCSLIIRDYANFLGLNGDNIVSLFRRDCDLAYRSQRRITSSDAYIITPQILFRLGVIASLFFFAAFMIGEYRQFNQPPKLDLDWPPQTISDHEIEISGHASPQAVLRLNDQPILLETDGSFKKTLKLNTIPATLTFKLTSPAGRENIIEKTYP